MPFKPDPLEGECALSLRVWNEMRGIDWDAIPYFVEIHGIEDVEALILDLIVIRDFFNG